MAPEQEKPPKQTGRLAPSETAGMQTQDRLPRPGLGLFGYHGALLNVMLEKSLHYRDLTAAPAPEGYYGAQPGVDVKEKAIRLQAWQKAFLVFLVEEKIPAPAYYVLLCQNKAHAIQPDSTGISPLDCLCFKLEKTAVFPEM